MSARLKADLALLFNSFIWGSTFVVVKDALADASPLVFLALRFLLATVAVLAVFGRRLRLDQPGLPMAASVVGLCLFGGYALQTIGLQYTTPSKSAFITSLSLVLVPVLAALWDRIWPSARLVAAVIIATAGLYFLTMVDGQLVLGPGDLLTLGCALMFAAHIVAIGHYLPSQGFAALAAGQVPAALAAAALCLPLFTAAGLERPFVLWTPRLFLTLVVTSVLATAVAFSFQAWAQQHTSPTRTALLFTLEPVFAAAVSYLVSGERLSARQFAGAGLILAGVLLAELKAEPPAAAANPAGGGGV